jgi:glyoxylase-like metal-dependent hydrolase (beta-lactamase superfamily II)
MMSIQIFPLSEGVFTIGHDKQFTPFDIENDSLDDRPIGSILVEVQPFLVKVNHQYILFDTGLGFHLPNGELQIHQNIRKHGIEIHEIKHVILSHLHKDHAGGIFYKNELGSESISFPSATYYVSKQEFDYAIQKGVPSYHVEDFEQLKNSPNIEWLDEMGSIVGCISYETVGGHCPYHACFTITLNNETIFFGGDVVPQLKQLVTRYMAKYDFDGRLSMELRQKYAEQGKAGNWQFLFYHDVKNPIARL